MSIESKFSEFDLLEEKNRLIAWGVGIIVFAAILTEISVDVYTGMENATTQWQKLVMASVGVILGTFSPLTIVASSALKQLGRLKPARIMGFIAFLLLIYSYVVWLAFYSTMAFNYSETQIKESVTHQAKKALLVQVQSDKSSASAETISTEKSIELNKQLTAAKVSYSHCIKLKGWKKVITCRADWKAKREGLESQIAEIEAARSHTASTIEALKSVSNGSIENESYKDSVPMPLGRMLTDSKEKARYVLLGVAILMTTILSMITNWGFYFVGELLGKSKKLHDFMESDSKPEQPLKQQIGFVHDEPATQVATAKTTALLDTNTDKKVTLTKGHSEQLPDLSKEEKALKVIEQATGKPTIKEIAGGIKVHLQPGQVLEKGDSESTEDKLKGMVKKGHETAEKLDKLAKDIELRTDERTQLRTENKDKDSKKTAKGRGKSSGIEFKFIDDAVISGDIFKFRDTDLSIRFLVDYVRYISPDGTSISKDKASVFMTMLKEKGRPLNKDSWQEWKLQQNKGGE